MSMEPRPPSSGSGAKKTGAGAGASELRPAARRNSEDSRMRARHLNPPLCVTTADVATGNATEPSSTARARAGLSSSSSAVAMAAMAAATATLPVAILGAVGGDALRPKRQLVACRIGSHTIEKCASPKKKALDPMRYMPDRATFYALFTVHVQFEGASADHQVYRTYKQLGALHSRLQKKYPKSNFPKDLPTMRKKRYDNEYIEQKKQALNEYLVQLLALPELRQSKTLREFLEDSRLSDDSDDEDANPSTRMLEGLPGTIVTVRAGQSFSVSLDLPHAGDIVSWQFTTKKHNIGFSATFNGASVCVYSREDSQLKPIKGYYKCTAPGVCTLNWDNTYTWSKGKVLVYWAEVEQNRAAVAAAAMTATVASPAPDTTGAAAAPTAGAAESDARRSGYIESNRNHALYPRRIVNSSISLITKPFVSGKAAAKQQQFKAGALIVERNVKFRGRHWYRKWFVLDTRKCVLRYYDSETAARRGLSLAKLNLNHKNASLAVTSALDAAPTPYMFIARTRKRCWKICASSLSEYSEWEHAISTAILTAQLSKRHRSGSAEAGGAVAATGSVAAGGSVAHVARTTGDLSLHGDTLDGLDDSDDSGDDDSGDDDDDDDENDTEHERVKHEDDDDESDTSRLQRYYSGGDNTANSRTSGLLRAYMSRASVWESQWKLALLIGVNTLLLSVRALPLETIGVLLLLCNACAAMAAMQQAQSRAKPKLKQS